MTINYKQQIMVYNLEYLDQLINNRIPANDYLILYIINVYRKYDSRLMRTYEINFRSQYNCLKVPQFMYNSYNTIYQKFGKSAKNYREYLKDKSTFYNELIDAGIINNTNIDSIIETGNIYTGNIDVLNGIINDLNIPVDQFFRIIG